MKKFLLSASALMLASAAFAATDGQTYEPINGFTCENLWTFDMFHTETEFLASPLAGTNARTATTDGKFVYVGSSALAAGDDPGQGRILKYDLMTGEYLGEILLTLDGAPYSAGFGCNSVGMDEYGHLYVGAIGFNSDGLSDYPLYIVDLTSGALSSVGSLNGMGTVGRIDYYDVIGDLTGEKAGATVMGVSDNGNAPTCFAWTRGQGETEWFGAWADGMSGHTIIETYPANATTFSSASVVRQVRDGNKTGEMGLFYLDTTNTLPALYSNDGAMQESFADVTTEVRDEDGNIVQEGVKVPAAGANGVLEMSVGDQRFTLFPEGQYDAPHACQFIVTAVDENFSFASMQQYWMLPTDGLGQVTDGYRIHCLESVALPQDANGINATLVFSFKPRNGMGVYRIAEEGYDPNASVADNVVANATIRVNGDVIAVSEVAESIEVYNVAGQKIAEVHNASEVAAPANGVYVVKAVVNGAPVVKKVIL